ncbi:MAG TPA: choice-of-anchor tandem repeat GloVer-containing protein [Pseudolabrys sp.]|nr:choice-of-anchor tandem repeat GloVer-containing protein [Pseudolabrys sp.]
MASPVLNTLFRFNSTNGATPQAGLTADPSGNGTLFGATSGGGASGIGTIFKLAPPAKGKTTWRFNTLYSFQGNGTKADGRNPQSPVLIDPKNGFIYGVTFNGGPNEYGTVFQLRPPKSGTTAWQESILANFQNATARGQNPRGALAFDSDGSLVGTAVLGGRYNDGTAFRLVPPNGKVGWQFKLMQNFGVTSADSMQPNGGVVRDPSSGVLYGTSSAGGAGGKGTVFSLKAVKGGWKETILYSFRGGNDGATPLGNLIIGSDGSLYGATALGGAYNSGVVFQLVPPTGSGTKWTLRNLHQFLGGTNDGMQPQSLAIGSKGVLYGSTLYGGGSTVCSGGCGTVYQLTPPPSGSKIWKEVILHRFSGKADSAAPQGMLVVDTADNDTLYGTTIGGYSGTDVGTIFRLRH